MICTDLGVWWSMKTKEEEVVGHCEGCGVVTILKEHYIPEKYSAHCEWLCQDCHVKSRDNQWNDDKHAPIPLKILTSGIPYLKFYRWCEVHPWGWGFFHVYFYTRYYLHKIFHPRMVLLARKNRKSTEEIWKVLVEGKDNGS